MTTTSVLEEVAAERARQEKKWGQQNHHPFAYLSIMTEEVGESHKGAVEGYFSGRDWDNYRTELIHTAAVAVAAVESFDRTPKPGFLVELPLSAMRLLYVAVARELNRNNSGLTKLAPEEVAELEQVFSRITLELSHAGIWDWKQSVLNQSEAKSE